MLARVKLSIPGLSQANLSQFLGNSQGKWEGFEFFVDNERIDADFWFVAENVWEGDAVCTVPDNRIYYLSAEASYHIEKFLNPEAISFFSQFARVYSCHAIDIPNYQYEPPFLPWMINSNHDSVFSAHKRDVRGLSSSHPLPKIRPLSMICSNQLGTPEHRLRFQFALAVKREFGDAVDWFGNGVNAVAEKWDALAPYRRTIVLENRNRPGLYTEKILDPFLAGCVPIYWGAPDIEDFLPVRRTHQLNLFDFSGSLRTIADLIEKPVSEDELSDLAEGKATVLTRLHLFSRLAKIIRGNANLAPNKPRRTQLLPLEEFSRPVVKGERSLLKRILGDLTRVLR